MPAPSARDTIGPHEPDGASIAALVGALLGARLGASHLPASWVKDVERNEVFEALALRTLAFVTPVRGEETRNSPGRGTSGREVEGGPTT